MEEWQSTLSVTDADTLSGSNFPVKSAVTFAHSTYSPFSSDRISGSDSDCSSRNKEIAACNIGLGNL